VNSEIVSLYTKTKLMLDYFVHIAGGLCDNLLTCIVRAWDYSKPLFVAPAMNTLMWNNPFTKRHLQTVNQLGIILIPPVDVLFYASVLSLPVMMSRILRVGGKLVVTEVASSRPSNDSDNESIEFVIVSKYSYAAV